jgi:hypothetical protein
MMPLFRYFSAMLTLMLTFSMPIDSCLLFFEASYAADISFSLM